MLYRMVYSILYGYTPPLYSVHGRQVMEKVNFQEKTIAPQAFGHLQSCTRFFCLREEAGGCAPPPTPSQRKSIFRDKT